GRLGPDAARLAAATAVLGPGANLQRAALLAGIDEPRAARAIDTLVATDILMAAPRLQFVHPIIRHVVYADLGDARRRVDHVAAAEILHGDGAPVAEVAGQLLKADPTPLPWAVDTLRAAAAEAYSSGAFARAATLLAHALAGERDPQARSRMLLELGRYEVASGSASAIERLQEALALVPQAPGHADIAG